MSLRQQGNVYIVMGGSSLVTIHQFVPGKLQRYHFLPFPTKNFNVNHKVDLPSQEYQFHERYFHRKKTAQQTD